MRQDRGLCLPLSSLLRTLLLPGLGCPSAPAAGRVRTADSSWGHEGWSTEWASCPHSHFSGIALWLAALFTTVLCTLVSEEWLFQLKKSPKTTGLDRLQVPSRSLSSELKSVPLNALV